MSLYSPADHDAIRRRIRRAAVLLTLTLLTLGALLLLSLHARSLAGVTASASALAVSGVFGVGFYLLPCLRYRGFLRDMETGLSREMTGRVIEISDIPEEHDGARVLPVRLLLEDQNDERLIYLNASKRALFPAPGARVHVTLFGRHIRTVEVKTGIGDS